MIFYHSGQSRTTPDRQRQSNMELLRIVAMFLVLVVHADFFSLGSPEQYEFSTHPWHSFFRILIESISIICVNVFILLSGYFGIHPTIKGACKFLFQCAFFLVGIYVVLLMAGVVDISARGVGDCLLMSQWYDFIKAYLALYILSPVLNAFVKMATRAQFKNVLICFYLFSTLYACISNGATDFEGGHSTVSFIGLYLLARYIVIYRPRLCNFNKYTDLVVWGGVTLFSTILIYLSGWLSPEFMYNAIRNRLYAYASPMVIICAIYFLLLFSKIRIHSKFINWIAASSFAVFLFHMNSNLIFQYYTPIIKYIYADCRFPVLLILIFLILVFVVAILLDQPRKLCWRLISHLMFNTKRDVS